MDILYLLIPLSLVLVFVIGAFLWWSVDNDQFEQLEEEGQRIFCDDEATHTQRSQKSST